MLYSTPLVLSLLSVWDANTATWGGWVTEGAVVSNTSGGWTLKDVLLTSYACETVRIGFLHTETSISLSLGWYIDEVEVSAF